jgi:hypothetical protein
MRALVYKEKNMEYLVQSYSVAWKDLPEKWQMFFKDNLYSFHNDCSFKLSRFFELQYDENILDMIGEIAPTVDLEKVKEIYLDVCW